MRNSSRKNFVDECHLHENQPLTMNTKLSQNWPIYLINLHDNTQRLQRSKAEFDRVGLRFERIEGVNGWTLSPIRLQQAYDATKCEQHGRHALIPAEIGCYLSHIEAWRNIANSPAPGGFVFEDDFSAKDWLPQVLLALSNDFGPWDIVKLFSLHEYPNTLMERHLDAQHKIVLPYKVPTCNTAYALRREAAIRLVQAAEPFFRAVDEDFKFYWEKKLRIGLVLPPPVGLGDQQASTGTIGDARRKMQNKPSIKQSLKSIYYQINYKVNLTCNRLLEWTQDRLKV